MLYLCFIINSNKKTMEAKNQMQKTIKNCLIAQNYSDAAKGINVYDDELHYKQIQKIMDTANDYESMRDALYDEKTKYIQKACRSAKAENIEVIFDECIIYFEFSFGQVSFHLFLFDNDLINFFKNTKVKFASHKWSGLTNSRKLLNDNYSK